MEERERERESVTGKHGKRKLERKGSDAEKRAERSERSVLKERKEREETGSVEGTAHMLSHCF